MTPYPSKLKGSRTWERFWGEKTQVKYDFSSTQVNLPTRISNRIIAWGKEQIADEDVYEVGEKFGREDEIHVTVLYGLHDEEPDGTREVVEKERPIVLELGEVTAFTNNPKFDVIKITVISPDLRRINKRLKESLEFTSDYPKYQPHCTIAYVKKGTADQYTGMAPFKGEKIKLDHLVFSSKNGEKTRIRLKGTPKL